MATTDPGAHHQRHGRWSSHVQSHPSCGSGNPGEHVWPYKRFIWRQTGADFRIQMHRGHGEQSDLVKQLENHSPGTLKQIVILRDSRNGSNNI